MMKQLKWKKLRFKDIKSILNVELNQHNKFVINELIFFYSQKVKNEIDLILNSESEIDFDFDKFITSFKKVYEDNYPVQYITSKCYFYNKEFIIKENVFIPRQETEFILDWIINNNLLEGVNKAIDLCSGSGAFTNSLALKYPHLMVCGIEKHDDPYKVSLLNKQKHNTNVNFIQEDIFNLSCDFIKDFDFIFCNPPYIDKEDVYIDISTKYEPKTALFADNKGYKYYFDILDKYWNCLKPNTKLVFEIGFNQEFVLNSKINKLTLLKSKVFVKDLDKNCRILFLKKE